MTDASVSLVSNLGSDLPDVLVANNFDTGVLRPFLGPDGKSYVTRMINGKPKTFLANVNATLSYDAWKAFDNAVIRAVRERLKVFADIRAAGLEYRLPNGMAHTMLQYQTATDITDATISMDPSRRSESDRPEIGTVTLPLPIIHKDFDFSAREILVSRNGQLALDTTTAELAARKVAEMIEKLTTGTAGSYSYGGGSIYGLTNFPSRSTKTDMTVPTGSNGTTVVNDILALRQLLIDNLHFGPYRLYVNSQWSSVLDNDFSTAKGDMTLRQRILAVEGIQAVTTLDFLPTTHWNCVLVEMSSETIRAVIGMEVQTLQWESVGGMKKHFKVMALQVPQLRADTAGNSGIAHGTTVAA